MKTLEFVVVLLSLVCLASSQNYFRVLVKFSGQTYVSYPQLPTKNCQLLSESFRGQFVSYSNGTTFLSGAFNLAGTIYSFPYSTNNSAMFLLNQDTGKQLVALLIWRAAGTIKYSQITQGYLVVNDTTVLDSTLYYYYYSSYGTSYYFASQGYYNFVRLSSPSGCSGKNYQGVMSTPCGALIGCGIWTINNTAVEYQFPTCQLSYFYIFGSLEGNFMTWARVLFNNLKKGQLLNFFGNDDGASVSGPNLNNIKHIKPTNDKISSAQ